MNRDKKFDTRLIERHLADGTITQEELDAHMNALPDAAEKAHIIDVPQPIVEQMKPEEEQAEEAAAEVATE